MTNCPNCGSEHIQLRKNTNVDWGRAIAGYALFGIVGGAVGAITGEDRNANACLDCGTSWHAADLYKIRRIIKKFTKVDLDLGYEEDRFFLNDFIAEISPYLKALSEAEEKSQLMIKNNQASKDAEPVFLFMYTIFWYSVVISVYLLFLIILVSLLGLLGMLISIAIGYFMFIKYPVDKGRRNEIKKTKKSGKIERYQINEKAKLLVVSAEDTLYEKIDLFLDNHNLQNNE